MIPYRVLFWFLSALYLPLENFFLFQFICGILAFWSQKFSVLTDGGWMGDGWHVTEVDKKHVLHKCLENKSIYFYFFFNVSLNQFYPRQTLNFFFFLIEHVFKAIFPSLRYLKIVIWFIFLVSDSGVLEGILSPGGCT